MIEPVLEKIAERILGFDEASLAGLWEKYRDRMERFDASREWERSVIIFFMINAVRAKNRIFNEQVLRLRKGETSLVSSRKGKKPDLKLVK
ncbi:MAG: hypothetical protein JW950_04705 [Deltaproteobacteria bacterium]|nr:hypothetical protein [Deltaproteobacteria bacterium]